MGVQRLYKRVEGRCRRVQGYVGVQRRYKGVEGRCRRVQGYMRVQRRYGDIWEYKDDTGIYGSTTTIQESRG